MNLESLWSWSKTILPFMTMILIIVLCGGGLVVHLRDRKKYPTDSAKTNVSRGKMLIGIGGTVATILIIVLVINWWTNRPTPTLPSPTPSAAKPADHWELCWMETKGSPKAEPDERRCNQVIDLKNEFGVMHIVVSYESRGLSRLATLDWDQRLSKEGHWIQEDPMWGGRWKLLLMSEDLFSGSYTNENTGGQGTLMLAKKSQ